MRIRKFKLPIYTYDIQFIEVESSKDLKKVTKIIKILRVDKMCYKRITDSIKRGLINGGECIWDHPHKRGAIILYEHTSNKERMITLGHEKRHLEDRILQLYSVSDCEATALLSGYLTQKLFKKWKKK